MPIPDCRSIVEQLASQYPQEWREAHTNGPNTEAFIRRLAWVLHSAVDPRFGLNGKRGDPNDISDDALCFDGESQLGDYDPTRGNAPVTVLDVIGGAGGPNPTPQWGAVGPSPKAAWVKPSPVGASASPGPVVPPPAPVVTCKFQPVDLAGLVAAQQQAVSALVAITAAVQMANNTLDRIEARLGEVETRVTTAVKSQSYDIDANAGYLGRVRGTIRPKAS